MKDKLELLRQINQARFKAEYQIAIALQHEYLSQFGEDVLVMQTLAVSYYHCLADDFDYYMPKALEWINKAIVLAPQMSQLYVTRADLLVMWGDYDQAAEDCRTALNLNPASLSAALTLISLIPLPDGVVDFSEGIYALEKIAGIHSDNPEIYNHLAWLYGKLGDTNKALSYVEQALKCKNPLRPDYL